MLRHSSLPLGELRHDPLSDHLNEGFLIDAAGRATAAVGFGAWSHGGRRREGFAFDTAGLPAFAENIVGADIAVLVFLGVPRVGPAPLLFQLQEFALFVFREEV